MSEAWRNRLWGSIVFTAAMAWAALAGCGGGGGVGEGGTGFASGPINGFGSVIVNDIEFDDSAAQVDDGDATPRSRADLRLGMTVEVDSDAIRSGSSGAIANATRIRFDSALLGRVEAVDAAAGTFIVLGQAVAADATTVFDERLAGRVAALGVGQIVEVYAVYDAANRRHRATRVEPRSTADVFRLRGFVTKVDAATQTLEIGAAQFIYAGAPGVMPAPAVGQLVRLALQTRPVAAGRWQVQSAGMLLRGLGEVQGASVKGLISALASVSSFQVDGRPVDASAAFFPDGTGGLALGVRVEVEGMVRGGVLRAGTVRIRSDDYERERGFDLRGAIEAVDSRARTIVVRGQTIGTARPDLRYESGSVADLAPGRRVEVRGVLAANGTVIEATRIKFE